MNKNVNRSLYELEKLIKHLDNVSPSFKNMAAAMTFHVENIRRDLSRPQAAGEAVEHSQD